MTSWNRGYLQLLQHSGFPGFTPVAQFMIKAIIMYSTDKMGKICSYRCDYHYILFLELGCMIIGCHYNNNYIIIFY